MTQPGFFDLDERHALLEKLGVPLPKLERLVNWTRAGFKVHGKKRKSNTGCKPFDIVLMFKVLVLQHFYNLLNEQIEYQLRDRYWFCRFLGLRPEGRVPDASTVWLFREQIEALDLMDTLFAELMVQNTWKSKEPLREGLFLSAIVTTGNGNIIDRRNQTCKQP